MDLMARPTLYRGIPDALAFGGARSGRVAPSSGAAGREPSWPSGYRETQQIYLACPHHREWREECADCFWCGQARLGFADEDGDG